MQLRLEPPPDLRDPGDPEAASRHRDLLARWSPRPHPGLPAPDREAGLRRERARMDREGWRCWIPDASRMARRLGPAAPALVFAAGTPDLSTPAVAVVGTRRPDAYGLAMAYRIGQAVGRAGALVLSGGALGVDGAAHEGALDAGGRTVAVLGSGLARPHPPSHRDLFRRVAARPGCCVLSEVPCLVPARAGTFPQRNRILAALADAVVVVQAGLPSGALITAGWARGLDVPVFAVPADAWYERSAGTIALLRDGARVLASPADLAVVPDLADLASVPWPRPGSRPMGLPCPWHPPSSRPPVTESPDAAALRAAMAAGASSGDALAAAAGLPAGRVQAALLSLEIAGEVRVVPGGEVVRL